jgi:hypothetical protein
VQITHNRNRAARICFFLAAMGLALTTCSGIGFSQIILRGGIWNLSGNGIIIAILTLAMITGVCTIYLLCGINIQRGGRASVVVATILGILHTLAILVGALWTLVMLLNSSSTVLSRWFAIIPTFFELLYAAAVAQLVYYLIKVLREPQV